MFTVSFDVIEVKARQVVVLVHEAAQRMRPTLAQRLSPLSFDFVDVETVIALRFRLQLVDLVLGSEQLACSVVFADFLFSDDSLFIRGKNLDSSENKIYFRNKKKIYVTFSSKVFTISFTQSAMLCLEVSMTTSGS